MKTVHRIVRHTAAPQGQRGEGQPPARIESIGLIFVLGQDHPSVSISIDARPHRRG